jgi:hypothetical protein
MAKPVYGFGVTSTSDGGGAVSPASHVHAATDITSGDVDDARLSANVPLLNAANAFTGANSFADTVTLTGDATTFDDLRISATMGTKPASNPPALKAFGPSGNLQGWAFDKTTNQQIFFEAQLPHTWKLGSTIYPHVHWSPSDTGTGVCIWKLEYSWANDSAAFGAPTTITASQAGSGTAWQHQRIAFESNAGIAGTGKTLSSILMCRLYRDAATDAYDNDAFLISFDIHYEIDGFGSDEEAVK